MIPRNAVKKREEANAAEREKMGRARADALRALPAVIDRKEKLQNGLNNLRKVYDAASITSPVREKLAPMLKETSDLLLKTEKAEKELKKMIEL